MARFQRASRDRKGCVIISPIQFKTYKKRSVRPTASPVNQLQQPGISSTTTTDKKETQAKCDGPDQETMDTLATQVTRKTKRGKRREKEGPYKRGRGHQGTRALVVALVPERRQTNQTEQGPDRDITPLLMRRGPPSHETQKTY